MLEQNFNSLIYYQLNINSLFSELYKCGCANSIMLTMLLRCYQWEIVLLSRGPQHKFLSLTRSNKACWDYQNFFRSNLSVLLHSRMWKSSFFIKIFLRIYFYFILLSLPTLRERSRNTGSSILLMKLSEIVSSARLKQLGKTCFK